MKEMQSPVGSEVAFRSIYGWVLAFLRPYRFHIFACLMLGLLMSGIQLLIPKFIQIIVDDVLPAKDIPRFFNLLWWMAAGAVILILSTIVKKWLDQHYQNHVSGDMQLAVFEQLRLQGYVFFERHPIGDILSLFHHELDSLQRIHKQYFPNILQNSITFIVTFVFMLTMSWQLSLVFIPGIILYYLIGPYFERKSAEYAEQLTKRYTSLNKRQYDSISSVTELRAYGREHWDLERLLSEDQQTATINVMYFKLINYRGAFRRVAVYFSGILMFLVGNWMNSHSMLTVGEFVAFMMMYYKVMFDLTILITNITEQKVLLLQTVRLFRFMSLKPDVQEPILPVSLPHVHGLLELRNVSFGYPDSPIVLKDISLTIRPGEKVAFVGTSGHGKSTLIKLLGRFYDPTEGDILLDGVPLRHLSFSQLREHIGYVFQETYLFGASIRDNIRFGRPDASEEEVIHAAQSAAAHEFITQLPQGYDTILGERGNKLSGGQKQRISIARMVLRKPSVLILDEATSALDNLTEAEVKRSIDRLFTHQTTIAVAHRFSTIRNYDKIYVLEHGRIIESGTYDELIVQAGAFYRLAQEEEILHDNVDVDF